MPEVALALPGVGRRLVFRWYKLTSDWKTRDWVEALMKRRPPPLAIVGGSSSDVARELARQLKDHMGDVAEADRPLLLLTTATADRVGDTDSGGESHEVDLTKIYPQRTYRFCFTNKQMAKAVMDFLMSQDDLRPDLNPVHMAQWDDDSYSRDLTDGFRQALPPWAGLPNPKRITSSVGSFLSPNRFEAEVVDQVLRDLEQTPQHRPMLAVTGQSTPCRRFLGELVRTSPAQARRLLVATGDAVSFNTVYRDRRVSLAHPGVALPVRLLLSLQPDRRRRRLSTGRGRAARDRGRGRTRRVHHRDGRPPARRRHRGGAGAGVDARRQAAGRRRGVERTDRRHTAAARPRRLRPGRACACSATTATAPSGPANTSSV